MLRHAEIVIGAPNNDFALTLRGMPDGMGKAPGNAFKVRKDPVASFVPQFIECRCKKRLVNHALRLSRPAAITMF
jgi:hypothetical protein